VIKSRARAVEVFGDALTGVTDDQKLFLCRYHYSMLFENPANTDSRTTHAVTELPTRVQKAIREELKLDEEAITENIDLLWNMVLGVLITLSYKTTRHPIFFEMISKVRKRRPKKRLGVLIPLWQMLVSSCTRT
jgi:hypothetical protein